VDGAPITERQREKMKESKRIAFVITSAVSFNVLMRGQLEFLRSRGADIDLYAGGPDEELEKLRKRDVGHVRKVPFRRQPHPFWDLVCLVWLTVLFSRRRYDCVIYSTPKAMLIGSLAAFLTGQRRRIAMIRGRGYENFQGLKRRMFVAMDRITFRVSHEMLFVSRSLMQAYREDGVELGDKGRVLGFGSSNGVDLDRFVPLERSARSALRKQLGFSDSDFIVAVVGRIRDYKGSPEVLEIARRLRDVRGLRFVFVGEIEDEELRLGLAAADPEHVRRFPPTSDVERYFQIANLHLFPSHREGFGNVAIEAAASGVPTFAFDVVGIRDSVIDQVTGRLFPFGDLALMEAEIRAAAADPAELARKYSGARKAVSERYSQPQVWREYAQVFLSCDHSAAGVAASDKHATLEGV